MADFNYFFSESSFKSEFLNGFYEQSQMLTDGLNLFFNSNTTITISNNDNNITLLGYAYIVNKSTEDYLKDILINFDESKIPEIKKKLLGQYIVLIIYEKYLYVFSDILQVRSVYYSIENKSICSRYNVLSEYIKADKNFFNDYKIFEYLAMKDIFYPTWLLNTTFNEKIFRLRPYEYLKIYMDDGSIIVKDFVLNIDNTKNYSLMDITSKTYETFKNIINHPELKEKLIGLTLTGGFDSRLVAFLAKLYYPNSSFRIATKKGVSSKDLKIAEKLSKISNTELRILEMDPVIHQDLFYLFTERFSPKENTIITPIILSSKEYDLGIGGAFGTELYNTIDYNSVDNYINTSINKIKKKFVNVDTFFTKFEEVIKYEFNLLSKHFILKEHTEKDIIRLFMLVCTGSFSSPMVSAYNIYGNNYEPYGTFPIIELGFQIPYKFMNSNNSIGRNCLVQKVIMKKINKRISRVNTTHYSPMSPLSIYTIYSYIIGHLDMKKEGRVNRIHHKSISEKKIRIHDWVYCSDEWCEEFVKKYASK